jgi:endonuclease/exonuclease/phosphatase (EEP) superfamily protein YafD
VTIATWNVREFYDDVCDLGTCTDDTFEEFRSTEEFEARVDQIADAIKRIDADVILLQEVETAACMDLLVERLGDEYQYVLGEIRRAGSLDTAVLVRSAAPPTFVPHRQNTFVREDGETRQFLREFMEVHTTINDTEVIVLNGHFRSQRNDDPVQRHAEAARAREIALEVAASHPGALIVLGGDLNDTPGSQTLSMLEDGGTMYRVAEELGLDAWTVNSNGNLNALDHLFLLTDRGTYVAESSYILRDVNSLGGSDHAALIAGFY